jgi:hypothetical protein
MPRECEKPENSETQIFGSTQPNYPITIGTIIEMHCKSGKIVGPGTRTTQLICRDDENGKGELVTLDGTQRGSCFPGEFSRVLC